MAKRLTWRKHLNKTGFARTYQGMRGYDLYYDGRIVGFAHWKRHEFDNPPAGYYWVASDTELGIHHRNTCDTPVADIETAKADCMAYVKECMAKKKSPKEGE